MLTFTEEEFEKYQNRIAGERQAAKLRRSYQGAVSRAQGAQFEQAIAGACDLYREKGMADIEKTPEPMRPIKRLAEGRFVAIFEKQAQPDYKGTLAGGQAVMFEAKSTATDRITQDRVTEDQAERLTRCAKLAWHLSFVDLRAGRYINCPGKSGRICGSSSASSTSPRTQQLLTAAA